MVYLSILFVLLAVVLICCFRNRVRFPIGVFFLIFLSLVLLVFYFISDYFTGQGIDESVIYHLRYGLGDAGFGEYVSVISGGVLAVAILAVFLYFIARKIFSSRAFPNGWLSFAPVSLMLLGFVSNPAAENIYNLLRSGFFQVEVDSLDYVRVKEVSSAPPLNLIYIYAESLEETYFDNSLFPGLLPNLSKIRDNAIVFKNVAQVTHSGWTIAGMVASQCGIPLFSASDGNSMSGMPQFLNGATCLGDVLYKNKYSLSYLGGASLDFAGKGNFYKTHGFSSVQGRDELSDQLVDASYKSAWGLYDDSLLEIAKKRLNTEAIKDSPFALFLLTLDTHHPKGHLSASCDGRGYADGSNEILNAVHCTDALISEFVSYVQESGVSDNTLIVIGSDHLAMKNTATDLLNQSDRKNLLIMIPPSLKEAKVIARKSSTLDISATILPLLGFETEALGFGRNILNDNTPRLIEKYEDFNGYMASARSLVESFWEYPQVVNDLYFKGGADQVSFGDKSINYPVLFLIGQNNVTEQVIFDFYSEKSLAEYLKEQKDGQRFLWIDRCSKLKFVFDSKKESGESGNCLAVGQLGDDRIWVKKLAGELKIKKKLIAKNLLKRQDATKSDDYLKHVNKLREVSIIGADSDFFQVLPENLSYESVFVKSAAGLNAGSTYVAYRNDSGEMKLQDFSRGLTLVGFSQGQNAEIIDRIDTCQEGIDLNNRRLVDVLNKSKQDFYLLMVQDSAVCSSSTNVKRYIKGSSLVSLPKISWRQSYVAIIYRDGSSFEVLGEENKPINAVFR